MIEIVSACHVSDVRFSTEAGFSQEQVKNEPMFFNCSLDFAYTHGGPITKGFIDAFLPQVGGYLGGEFVFDSRVHMLMPGWYPCIPGYHHDDVARTRSDGQPDYRKMPYRSNHCMGLVNGDICPTVFALGKFQMPDVPLGGTIYKVWHPLVEAADCRVLEAPSDHLLFFDWQSFHTGQKARTKGWRWFGRVSWDTDRVTQVTNEIRRQVQVYLEFPMEGW